MIRRSTLVLLTCLGALGVSAASATSAIANSAISENRLAAVTHAASSPILMAQSPEAVTSNVLSIGSRGRAVRALQSRLEDTGYYNGPIDGIYGLATQRSVRAFQEDQDFEPTGRLDDPTWEALEAFEPRISDQRSTASGESAESATSSSPSRDLPPIEPQADSSVAADSNPAEPRSSGLGKVLGLGLGLAAVLSSFGVGFFMANRSKAEAENDLGEGDAWSETDLDVVGLPENDAVIAAQGSGSESFSPVNGSAQNGFSAVSSTTGNGSVTDSAMARVPAAARNGQLGGTVPMGQADIFDGLIKDLHNSDPHQRRKVIWELGQRGNSLAVQPLVDAMIDADSKEKSLVLAALSEIGMRSLRPMNRALAIALQDDNPEVRKNAIRDLTRIYELVVQISQMLGHAQEDEDPEVRQTATWALDQLNRIRQSQDIDSNMRSLPTNNTQKTNRFAL